MNFSLFSTTKIAVDYFINDLELDHKPINETQKEKEQKSNTAEADRGEIPTEYQDLYQGEDQSTQG